MKLVCLTLTPYSLGRALLTALISASLVQAQEGHPPPTPPPPGAKSVVCHGRPIPQLEDITVKSGITFTHASDPAKKYLVESMSGGVILIDYDRDGWPDIYFTNAPSVATAIADPVKLGGEKSWGRLYHNNHDGTFTDVTVKAGLTKSCFAMGGAVGDYDNDGWPDMYLACLGHNILYHNNGDGTFTNVTAKTGVDDVRWSTGAAFGDYDLDGYVDLMVTNYVDFHLDDLPQFGSAPNCKYRGIDVQCGPRGLRGAGDSLFHNNGDGTFTNVSKAAGVSDADGYYGMTALFADFNNVGRPDIYVANDSTPKFLYKNLGNGTFKDIGLQSGTAVSEDGSEQASMGVAIGDYNHTGRPSLYITNFSDENDLLYRNDGDWNFTEVSYSSGLALPSLPYVKWGTDFIDVDNDGWLDLILVDGHVYPQVDTGSAGARYREPKFLSMNQGDGTFCDASTQAGPALMEKRVSRGLAVGDLFNDGNMDVVIGDLDGAPMLLRNHGVPGRHFVSFELAGDPHPHSIAAPTPHAAQAASTGAANPVAQGSATAGGNSVGQGSTAAAHGTAGLHASNRLALNARLKITAGGMTQTEEIHSGGSYLSQNDLRVHFGLGAATKVDTLEIHWPSGLVEILHNIPADHFYSILEGKGLVSPDQVRPVLKATD